MLNVASSDIIGMCNTDGIRATQEWVAIANNPGSTGKCNKAWIKATQERVAIANNLKQHTLVGQSYLEGNIRLSGSSRPPVIAGNAAN
jgi:hypothetical protein